MVVLGLTDTAPSGAAIVIDGVAAAVADEATLSRVANAHGMPRRALTEVLDRAGVTAREIDLVMVAVIDARPVDRVRPFGGNVTRGRRLGAIPGVGAVLDIAERPVFALRRRLIRKILDQEFAITAPVEFVHRHLAHAAGAYFTSGFTDAIAVTMDGGGDGDWAHVYDIRKGHFRRIGQAPIGDAEPAARRHDEQFVADFVQRHLGGNKPDRLVLAGDAFRDLRINRRLGELPGIERVHVRAGDPASGLAPGAALAACMLNRKHGRMATNGPSPAYPAATREPELERV